MSAPAPPLSIKRWDKLDKLAKLDSLAKLAKLTLSSGAQKAQGNLSSEQLPRIKRHGFNFLHSLS